MSLMMVSLVVSMVLVVVSMVLVVVFMVAFVVVSSMVVFVVVSSMMVLVMTFSMMVVFMMVSVVVSVMVLVVMSVVVFVMVSMMFVVFVSVMSMMVLSMVVLVMVLSMMVLVVSMVVFGVLSGGALDWLLVVSSRSSLVSSHNVGDFSSALFLASREDIVSASCSDIGSNVTASCVGECLAVGAVLVAWSALVGAFLSFLLSAVEVGLRVRPTLVEGLSIAVTSLWDVVWLESLCS